jgi:hypothetical protein
LSGGSLSLGGALSAKDLSLTATNGLNINRDLTATGNLTLATSSNTGVQQTAGALAVNGTTSVNAGPGQVSLTGLNNFNGAVSVTTLGANNVTPQRRRQSIDPGHFVAGQRSADFDRQQHHADGRDHAGGRRRRGDHQRKRQCDKPEQRGQRFHGQVRLNNRGQCRDHQDINDLKLGPSTVGGSLTATSSGAGSISQSGALNVTGASTFTLNGFNKDVLLGTSANTFGGGVTVNGTGSVKDMAFRYGTASPFPRRPATRAR